MLKVGLTGGIGSGKSTVSKMLKELSISVIDADHVARDVLISNPMIIKQVKSEFGISYVDDFGKLKRGEFGDFIFGNPEARKRYEAIIIPCIITEIFRKIEEFEEKGDKLCVIDAPTLIEHNLHKNMDLNILVWVDAKNQIERVIKRDKITSEAALLRIEAQIPLENKRKIVDYVIDNNKTVENTRDQLMGILKEIQNRGNK